MRKLFILLIFSAQIASADSSSFSVDFPITNILITNNVCDSFSPIGLKPSNLILTDLYGCKSNYLFTAVNDSQKSVTSAEDRTWVVTEPFGGFLGGVLGGLAGAIIVALAVPYSLDSSDPTVRNGFLFGYAAGCGLGIWSAGKWIEREKGNLIWTIFGSMAGEFLAYAKLTYNNNHDDYSTGIYLVIPVLPIISGVIAYRMSFKK
ncbi:MAG: hypothetical protein PHX21_01315 [bacterium]|nr:hypothetical protein [bacterium]